MIRHVLTFSFHDHVDHVERQAILDELDTFPGQYASMRNWTIGRNISRRDDTYEWAFVVDFDSEADLLEYLSSETHEAFVVNRWRPVIASRSITSFEVGSSARVDRLSEGGTTGQNGSRA